MTDNNFENLKSKYIEVNKKIYDLKNKLDNQELELENILSKISKLLEKDSNIKDFINLENDLLDTKQDNKNNELFLSQKSSNDILLKMPVNQELETDESDKSDNDDIDTTETE